MCFDIPNSFNPTFPPEKLSNGRLTTMSDQEWTDTDQEDVIGITSVSIDITKQADQKSILTKPQSRSSDRPKSVQWAKCGIDLYLLIYLQCPLLIVFPLPTSSYIVLALGTKVLKSLFCIFCHLNSNRALLVCLHAKNIDLSSSKNIIVINAPLPEPFPDLNTIL